MNNNYDRDVPGRSHTPGETYEEMTSKGWELSGDGFWFKEHEPPETRLLLLQSGENILTGVTEVMNDAEVILHDPKLVTLEVATSGLESTIGYSDYQPLSKGRSFRIKSSFIVSNLEPLEELARSYELQVGISTHG